MTVADPDLQIRGGGSGWGGHSDPEIMGVGGRLVWKKRFFGPSGLILV